MSLINSVDYSNETTKWESYQFSDPFATDAFVCLNTKLNVVCRPNCDYYPKVDLKEEILFFDNLSTINVNSYKLCPHCDVSNPKTRLDLELIKTTIDTINRSIGFTQDANELKRRAYSVPSLNTKDGLYAPDRQLTKNESEHFKLVELACRHIAAAAVASLTKQQIQDTNESNDASSTSNSTKKKRRGGVLGFKELASKSKLSAWHFHRVFKSVTGLTPKSYGDQCWEFIKNRGRAQTSRQRSNYNHSHFKSSSEISNNFKKRPLDRGPGSAQVQDAPVGVAPNESVSPSDTTATITSISASSSAPSSSPRKKRKSTTTTSTPSFESMASNILGSTPDTFLDLNKNSLDINVTPFRHHSLDLSNSGFDLTDFSPNYITQLAPPLLSMEVSNKQDHEQHLRQQQQFNAQQHQVQNQSSSQLMQSYLPTQQPQHIIQSSQAAALQKQQEQQKQQYHQQQRLKHQQQAKQHELHGLTHQNNTKNGLLPQIDESQWPTLKASTPPELEEDVSRFLTPSPQTSNPNYTLASANNHTDGSSISPVGGSITFYEALNSSPLDTVGSLSNSDDLSDTLHEFHSSVGDVEDDVSLFIMGNNDQVGGMNFDQSLFLEDDLTSETVGSGGFNEFMQKTNNSIGMGHHLTTLNI